MPKEKDVQSVDSVRDWLNICQYWAWFFLNEPYRELTGTVGAAQKLEQAA